MKCFASFACLLLAVTTPLGAAEIDFVEDFALATDRSSPLGQW